MATDKVKTVIGVFEKVDFPKFGVNNMMAKIDTGAYTGSLHCTKIHVDKTGKKPVLHFSPFDHPETVISTSDFKRRSITSSNGQAEKRYFIDTTINLRDKDYPIRLSLANRSAMKWPVLIGRKFMQQNGLLVDAAIRNRYKV